MTIYIKNMVCNRCKMVVTSVLGKLGLHAVRVELGEVIIREDRLSPETKDQLTRELQPLGFELLDDKKTRTIEKIKTLITDLVQNRNNRLKIKLSEHLQQALHHDYSALSHLFSSVEGITIEKYYILQKIEKVKELLVYDELTLSEIAYQLHYSSVAHLSNQFKKVTGHTPSGFKALGPSKRRPLDAL